MSVLLASETAEFIHTGTDLDEHGWDKGVESSLGLFSVSVQETPSVTDATATDAGGAGPSAPSDVRSATVYAPPHATVGVGDVVVARGARWRVNSLAVSKSPVGDELDCIVLGVTA